MKFSTTLKCLVAMSCTLIASSALAGNSDYCHQPSPPTASGSQSEFDEYAWKTFIALNWPVSKTERGTPDCSEDLGTGTPSWQTFKLSTEVFLPNAKNPGSWNAGYQDPDNSHPLIQYAKASNNVELASVHEAVGGWLIDQQGNPTYFQIWVNQIWYDYVVKNDFYNKDNFGNDTRIDMPDNATEVKSSWRILTEKDDHTRYVTQQSKVAAFNSKGKPTGQFQSVTLGLVGMHAIVKAPGFPQWIWATFEHIDNVPDTKAVEKSGPNGNYWTTEPDPQPGVIYSYFNAKATNANTSPCNNGDPNDCIAFTTPNPLTRITPIREDAAAQNQAYQGSSPVKDTVFEHYQLITTQWPTMPDNPGATNGNPTPTISANVTMESYIQSTSNCTNCHGTATLPGTAVRSDYSFLFNSAHSASKNTY